MSQAVNGDPLLVQGGTGSGRRLTMLVYQILNAMDTETSSSGARKQQVALTPLGLMQPGFQHGARGPRDRRTALFSTMHIMTLTK